MHVEEVTTANSMVLLCFQLKLTEAAAQVDFTDTPQKQCLFDCNNDMTCWYATSEYSAAWFASLSDCGSISSCLAHVFRKSALQRLKLDLKVQCVQAQVKTCATIA